MAASSLVLGVLAVAVLALGLWPAPLLDVMQPTVENLVQQITVSQALNVLEPIDEAVVQLRSAGRRRRRSSC